MEIPQGLEEKILARISREVRKERIARVSGYGVGAGLSLFAIIRSGIYVFEYGKKSGFFQYLSLLLSENGSIFSYWKEWSFSVAESFPIVGVMMFLGAIGVGIFAASKVFTNLYTYEMGRFA